MARLATIIDRKKGEMVVVDERPSGEIVMKRTRILRDPERRP
jgi:hypothetical protein